VPLSLSLDDPPAVPPSAPPPAPSGPGGLRGPFEWKLSLDDDSPPAAANSEPPTAIPLQPIPLADPEPERAEEPKLAPSWEEHDSEWEREREEGDLLVCRQCGRQVHPDSARCYSCGTPLALNQRGPRLPRRRRQPWREVDPGDDREPRRPSRRDAEPHRGSLILTLGIIGLVCLGFCGPIGIILGVIAWVMGYQDLDRIKKQQMDSEGAGSTQAGMVCGISGTILNFLWTLACAGFFWLVFLENQNRNMATRPRFGAPPPVMKDVPWDKNGWDK